MDIRKKNGFVILTHDADFCNLTALLGFPPKVVWLRTGNVKTQDIADILTNYSDEIRRFVEDETHGCFEIFKLGSA